MQSHAQLDTAEDLDAGDSVDLGVRDAQLQAVLPQLTVFDCCCGTDCRHGEAICRLVTLN
jgi:homocysteine S-methyltransferase